MVCIKVSPCLQLQSLHLEFAIADFCSFWVTLADASLKGVAYTHISYFEVLEVFSEDTPRAVL